MSTPWAFGKTLNMSVNHSLPELAHFQCCHRDPSTLTGLIWNRSQKSHQFEKHSTWRVFFFFFVMGLCGATVSSFGKTLLIPWCCSQKGLAASVTSYWLWTEKQFLMKMETKNDTLAIACSTRATKVMKDVVPTSFSSFVSKRYLVVGHFCLFLFSINRFRERSHPLVRGRSTVCDGCVIRCK